MIDESSNVKGNTCVCCEFRGALSPTQKTRKTNKQKKKPTRGNLAPKLAARLIYEEPVVLVGGGGEGQTCYGDQICATEPR